MISMCERREQRVEQWQPENPVFRFGRIQCLNTKKALEHAKHRDLPICTILFSYNCIRNKETTRVYSFGQKSGTRYWAGESHGTVLFCLSRTGVP